VLDLYQPYDELETDSNEEEDGQYMPKANNDRAKGSEAKIGVERSWVGRFDQRRSTKANDGSNFGGTSGECN